MYAVCEIETAQQRVDHALWGKLWNEIIFRNPGLRGSKGWLEQRFAK